MAKARGRPAGTAKKAQDSVVKSTEPEQKAEDQLQSTNNENQNEKKKSDTKSDFAERMRLSRQKKSEMKKARVLLMKQGRENALKAKQNNTQ